jgi:hypothetical protein
MTWGKVVDDSACWQASQIDSSEDSLELGRLFLLRTSLTIEEDGCPKRACHRVVENLFEL